MAHQYAEHVVGGIAAPRYLLVGDELSPNVSFEDDLTGVTGSAVGVAARELDSATPWGDYVLTIADDGNAKYADIEITTGDDIAGRRFIVIAWARNDAAEGDAPIWCAFNGISGTHEKEFTLGQDWLPMIVHEVHVPMDATGETLTYRIRPFAKAQSGTGTTAKIRIDRIVCREIFDSFNLPLPARGKQMEAWKPKYQAKIELIDRSIRSVGKRVQYAYQASYERLTAAQEVLRSRLINTEREILFFPHEDAPITYFVMYDEDFERTWSFGVAAMGHEAQINLIGTEMLPVLPDTVIDELTEYSYEAGDLYFESFGDNFVYTS